MSVKIKDCIICDKNHKVGDIAPEHWCICIDCLQKGFMVCEEDKRVFNRKSVLKSSLFLDNTITFKIGSYDLLEDVTRGLGYGYENLCCKDCYNLHYINNCIDKLQTHLNMIWMEETIPILGSIANNNTNREDFKTTLTNKISELENYKQKYLIKS